MTEDYSSQRRGWAERRGPTANGKIGVWDSCFGGGIANTLAVRHGSGNVNAAAPPSMAGSPPAHGRREDQEAPMMMHYRVAGHAAITGNWRGVTKKR